MTRETNENRVERYNRQCLIPGWNQEKLDNAKIAIIGSDHLASYTAIVAASLGVGKITIIDDKIRKGTQLMGFRFDDSWANSRNLEQVVSAINPFVEVKALDTSLVNAGSKYFLEKNDVILDMTNDSKSKAICMEYGLETKTPCITASTTEDYGKLMLFNGDLGNIHPYMSNFGNKQQGPITSIPIAGIAVEEARKIIMNENNPLEKTIYYNLGKNERFAPMKIGDEQKKYGGSIGNVVIVGAGALGNGIALAMQHLNMDNIYIIDADEIEETNLNRQIFYYNCVGEKKAEALARKLSTMGRKANPLVEKFPVFSFPNNISLIFDCVDNFKTRLDLNNFAVKNRIPLISGGTNYHAGQVAVYVPGKTSCIEHQLNLSEVVKKTEEEERESQSCVYAPNPSVVTSNIIISGLMAAEAKIIFSGNEPLKGMLKYGSHLEGRVGFIPLKEKCSCDEK
jgi:molybdopterin/thiamine biosynthesis adenylyltransferase